MSQLGLVGWMSLRSSIELWYCVWNGFREERVAKGFSLGSRTGAPLIFIKGGEHWLAAGSATLLIARKRSPLKLLVQNSFQLSVIRCLRRLW